MLFWTLLLSHVVGDFPLQTDAIYRLKTKYRWGVLPHVMICSLMNILVLSPYLHLAHTWYAIAFLALVHTLFDKTKISFSEKTARDNLFQFLIDQLLHLFSIWLSALWLSQFIDLSEYTASGWLANKEIIIQLTAIFAATFAGVPVIYYAQKYWCNEVKKYPSPIHYPPLIKRFPGYFERFTATFGLIMGGFWITLAAAAFIPRIVINWRDEDRPSVLVSSLVGLLLSLLCSLMVWLI